MKLRNKKTGEIVEFETSIYADTEDRTYEYNSISELNADWEDYEEPKGYWYYDTTCGRVDKLNHNEDKELDSSIGNCFETKEEGEKAVEKLKAWKRLKDKGAEFYGWNRTQAGSYVLCMRWKDRIPRSYEVYNELHLLFGGEE